MPISCVWAKVALTRRDSVLWWSPWVALPRVVGLKHLGSQGLLVGITVQFFVNLPLVFCTASRKLRDIRQSFIELICRLRCGFIDLTTNGMLFFGLMMTFMLRSIYAENGVSLGKQNKD